MPLDPATIRATAQRVVDEDTIARAWNNDCGDHDPVTTPWHDLDKAMRQTIVRVINRLPDADLAAQSHATALADAARKACDALRDWWWSTTTSETRTVRQWNVERDRYLAREHPETRECVPTLDLEVWGKGADGEDIPCNLHLTPDMARAIVKLAAFATTEGAR